MKTNSSPQRVKVLTTEGLRVGAKYFFLFSLFLEFLLSIIYVGSIFFEIDEISSIASILYFIGSVVLLNFTFWLFGVVPITTIGTIGGTLIGLIFSIWEKRTSGILAGFIGVIVGIALVLFTSYMYWLIRSINFHNHYTFLYYLLPLSIPKEISRYFLFVNPYFIPSVVSVLVWAYTGWRINKIKVL